MAVARARQDQGEGKEMDLSHLQLEVLPDELLARKDLTSIRATHNRLLHFPLDISSKLTNLDLGNNLLVNIPQSICKLSALTNLCVKNNEISSGGLPKSLDSLKNLEFLNLAGNRLEEFPLSCFNLRKLRQLNLGSNLITCLPCSIGQLQSLEVLYLGGNRLNEVPATIGMLFRLISLTLSHNRLETIPCTIAHLQRLQSLSLHNNRLTILPTDLVKLKNLQHLSLRSNPLVAQFVRDMTFDPPSLKELCGRVVKVQRKLHKFIEILPLSLVGYMNSSHECVNPKCKGVYFEARVEHVKFVDFCGKYRVPLLQYLCSPRCTHTPAVAISSDSDLRTDSENEEQSENYIPDGKLKKILLG